MAGVIKRNPLVASDAWEQVGKTLTWFTVSGTNLVASTGVEFQIGWEADGAVNALLAVIQKTTTVIAMGPIVAGTFSIAVEGEYTGQDNFDGTVNDGDLKRMDTEIKALGTIIGSDAAGAPNGAGIDLSASIVSTSLFELDPLKAVAIT